MLRARNTVAGSRECRSMSDTTHPVTSADSV